MPFVHCNSLHDMVWEGNINSSSIYFLHFSVQVCKISIPSSSNLVKRFRHIISDDENLRASKYHQHKDTLRFLVSRVMLRLLLGKYLNLLPQEIEFEKNKNSKPYVKHDLSNKLCFNVSHSENLILIAISDSEIGIDIEKINSNFSYMDILDQYFSDEEINFINKSINPADDFYLLWTRKEALLKATSKGIDNDLPFIPSLEGRHEVDQKIIGSDKDFYVSSFRIADNYIGSVAYTSGNKKLRFRDISEFSFSG